MGFEIPVDVDYFEHPKTLLLVGLIGVEADIYPLRLWRWCALYAKNGVVKGGRAAVESAVKWPGAPGKLYRALMKAGFIEGDGETVHDWMEHIGRAILLYEKKKQKQRERYAAGILPEENGRIPPIPSHPIPSYSEKPNSKKSAADAELFSRFWEAFPSGRKQGRGAAFKAWQSAIKKTDAEALIVAAAEYARSPVGCGKFVKGPAPWLNQECWLDDREAWSRVDGEQKIGLTPEEEVAATVERLKAKGYA